LRPHDHHDPQRFLTPESHRLPNLLTYFRLATIPLIIVVLAPPASPESLNLAFVLFIIASITDYLDGIMARRRNLVTSIGKLLDPLADKLLTSAVMIMLIPLAKIPAWLVFTLSGGHNRHRLRSIAASQGLISTPAAWARIN